MRASLFLQKGDANTGWTVSSIFIGHDTNYAICHKHCVKHTSINHK